ncbi:MAG: glycosyltransferase family 39 protein [Candidatus Aenigmatarchaeota archaeon]
MEIEIKQENIPLILISIIAIIFLYFTLNVDMLGEDEGFYFNNVNRIIQNDLKPFDITGKYTVFIPFIPTITAALFLLFGSSLLLAKVIITIFSILVIFILFLVTKKHGFIASISSILILLSMPLFTHFSFLYYVEIPIAFFSILLIYLFSTLDSNKKAIITAVVLSTAFYTKQSALIFVILLFLSSLYKLYFKKDKKYFKLAFITLLITIIAIVPWVLYNLFTYGYPHTEGLNIFFKQKELPEWLFKSASISPNLNIIGIFTPMPLLLFCLGLAYFLYSKESYLALPLITVIIFFIIFLLRTRTGFITEERYFIIIFPQVALVGGVFLQKLYEKNNKIILFLTIIFVFMLYQTITVALNTANSQRYPTDYKETLNWIKMNTQKNDIIFTAYRGSLLYYANRYNKWSEIEEFPQLMTTQNSTYIYETLKRENVSYIFIWRNILADKYIIPESNIHGLFTYNFLNTVINDTEHFNITFSNENNLVIKLL